MKLTKEQKSPSEEYLSDFLYIDTARLSHYYSQLSADGLVTQSKRLSKDTHKSTDNVGLKAVVTGSRQSEAGSETSIELQIDPTFSRPQDTLDALYSAGYIGDSLTDAGIGTLFLTHGSISMFDVRMLKTMWPHLGEVVAEEGAKNVVGHAQRQKARAAAKKEYSAIMQLISNLPHSLHGSIISADHSLAWFTLKPECMLVNPDDLAFKHGCDLPGEWHMLGIVDAKPNDTIENIVKADALNAQLEGATRVMLLHIRQFFGRPEDRYGVTPVLIFRTIKKSQNPI
ncbi:hypothetical protein FHW83_004557 [Duganella sp. SG902]|uniref:hypothetical protein n=1 Tax=Duganella sp. SG902 TaxID=2587016 RepID=UPI00159D6FC6|nr:hypothetical protein [Duganella sp. SG902]NVM78727.1 hypothetical protein [Duganella sp. SG902]